MKGFPKTPLVLCLITLLLGCKAAVEDSTDTPSAPGSETRQSSTEKSEAGPSGPNPANDDTSIEEETDSGFSIEIEFDPSAFTAPSPQSFLFNALIPTAFAAENSVSYTVSLRLATGESLVSKQVEFIQGQPIRIQLNLSPQALEALKSKKTYVIQITNVSTAETHEVVQVFKESAEKKSLVITPQEVLATRILKAKYPDLSTTPPEIIAAVQSSADALAAHRDLLAAGASSEALLVNAEVIATLAAAENTAREQQSQSHAYNTELICLAEDLQNSLLGVRMTKSIPSELFADHVILRFKPNVPFTPSSQSSTITYDLQIIVTVSQGMYIKYDPSYSLSKLISDFSQNREGTETYAYNRSAMTGLQIPNGLTWSYLSETLDRPAQLTLDFRPLITQAQANLTPDRFKVQITLTSINQATANSGEPSAFQSLLHVWCGFKYRPVGFKHDEPLFIPTQLAPLLPEEDHSLTTEVDNV